ncbi:MAG: DNA primase [Bacteroidales bacterium]|jgi:DNA primase|nr:DNA primase [Bacteroidales bacterium]
MIKPEIVEDILNAARIEEVVGDFVRLTKRGVNYVGSCPFHNERTPSFVVSPVKGMFKCFGCGVGGDSATFIMKHENYNYGEALRYLANKYNIELKEEEQTPSQIKEHNEREALYTISSYAKDCFSINLHETEEGKSLGLTYFREREFSAKTIEKFQLGYASQERDAFTQQALKNGYSIENLEKSGLTIVKENNYYIDRFCGRVIFPVHNFSGRVVGFGGRILSAIQTAHSAKYINSPETGIYHKSDVLYGLFMAKTAIKKEDKCFLVEGYTDVISLYQNGIENVTASSGTSLTVGQIKLIRKLTNNITIIYDGDSAGIKAALRGISLILKEGMNVRVVLLPEGEDPDSFARNNTKDDCLTYIKEQEESFIKFKTNLLLKDIGNDTIKKAQLINDIATDISLINDLMMRSVFIQECSKLLNIPEETLVRTVSKNRVKAYYDAHSKENELASTNEEKQTLVDATLLPVIPAINLPLKPMSVENIERAILSLLINRGENIVCISNNQGEQDEQKNKLVSIRLDQFIFDDLHNDNIVFENKLYRKFFDIYADVAEKQQNNIAAVLRRHEDENIRNLCIELEEIPIEASPLWESDRIKNYIRYVHNDEGKSLEDVIRTLQMIKLIKIRRIRDKKQEELKQTSQEDDELICLYELQKLNKKIAEIEDVLGVVCRQL